MSRFFSEKPRIPLDALYYALYNITHQEVLHLDVQLKKGLLEVCVLTALKKESSYGYKIVGDISPYVEISESTLYPILKRLENKGCLVTYTQEHNGRLRKYYQITPEGFQRIRDFIAEWEELKKVYDFIIKEEPSQ